MNSLKQTPASSRQSASPGLHWRLLGYFSFYRLVIASVLFGVSVVFEKSVGLGAQEPMLFQWTSFAYMLLAILLVMILNRWKAAFDFQLTTHVLVDVACLVVLLHANGGARSGMSMLLLIVLIAAGMVGQGRLVLFYAAMATLGLLAEQAFRVFHLLGDQGEFFITGMTSAGFFGTAILSRLLANRMMANEELARLRGIELADQVRINEQVIREMQDGVLVVDDSGTVRHCNPRARLLLGYASAEEENDGLDAYSPKLAEEFQSRKTMGIESECVMPVPRTGRTLRARFLPPGAGGNALVFIEDVGQLQQEARQVKLAALGRLTANMAHEIRNPLSAISQAAELLADEPTGKDIPRLTRIIGDNTQRLNHLVSEVVELGRRDRVTPESIDINMFFSNLLEERALSGNEIVNRVDVSIPARQKVRFDRGHLHRIMTNLLDNALRHASQTSGAIRIHVENNQGQNRPSLHIVDDGKGVGEAEREHLFEPFFTTHSSGTGLGLYIARELCEANGARLFLLENAPGAHFCISFAPLPTQMQDDAS